MSDSNPNHPSESEIDLLEVFSIVWEGKRFLLAFVAIAALFSLIISLSLNDKYQSSALLAPKYDTTGSLGSVMGQYSGLADMAGIDIPGSDKGGKVQIALKTIESFHFFDKFLYEDYLILLMAVKEWDSSRNEFTLDSKIYDVANEKWNLRPTSQQAHSQFLNEFDLSEDINTGFITLSFEHLSPIAAKDILESVVFRLHEFMRQKDVSEAEQAIEFLTTKIDENNLLSLDEMFARLIEEQTKTIMLANVSDDYIFRVIEPPVIAEEKSSPQRALICLIGTFLGTLLGLLVLFIQRFYLHTKI